LGEAVCVENEPVKSHVADVLTLRSLAVTLTQGLTFAITNINKCARVWPMNLGTVKSHRCRPSKYMLPKHEAHGSETFISNDHERVYHIHAIFGFCSVVRLRKAVAFAGNGIMIYCNKPVVGVVTVAFNLELAAKELLSLKFSTIVRIGTGTYSGITASANVIHRPDINSTCL